MSAKDYIEYAYLDHLASSSFDGRVGPDWIEEAKMWALFQTAMQETIQGFGFVPSKQYDELIEQHFNGICLDQGVAIEGDEYTGRYAMLIVSRKDAYIKEKLNSNPVTPKVERLGQQALARAMLSVAQEEGWGVIEDQDDSIRTEEQELETEAVEIPASDRIVSIGHNQASPLIDATEELIDQIENTTNSIDGDTSLRARIIGQLRAAKELLLAGVFKVYLLQVTLLDALEYLSKRYEKEIIGGLASALLAEILKAIAGG